jgi:CDP-diacylglycerol--serine O-phosphatidyltransferase
MSKRLKKGIYIIPSLFTCGNIVCGYLSILSSISENFVKAAWLIIFAIIFDMIDGRLARLTKTTSEFGIQLDSLADLISFGIATSIMMYQFFLIFLGKAGTAIVLLFVLCSVLRLAKFNINANKENVVYNSFTGLPTPASAGFLVSFVLSYELFTGKLLQSVTLETIDVLKHNMLIFFRVVPIIMIILSLLMISNIPYVSFKKIKFLKPRAFRVFILLVLFVWLMLIFPQNIIFIVFTLYALSGIVGLGVKYYRIYKKKNNFKNGENDND